MSRRDGKRCVQDEVLQVMAPAGMSTSGVSPGGSRGEQERNGTGAHSALLSLGSNLGNRLREIQALYSRLDRETGGITAESAVMETAPVGVGSEHGAYINVVVEVRWDDDPLSLLGVCEGIERASGRKSKGTLAPRTADIDILLFDTAVINTPRLRVPHPELLHRRFCIEGIAAIDAGREHPVCGKPFSELHASMPESLRRQHIAILTVKLQKTVLRTDT